MATLNHVDLGSLRSFIIHHPAVITWLALRVRWRYEPKELMKNRNN